MLSILYIILESTSTYACSIPAIQRLLSYRPLFPVYCHIVTTLLSSLGNELGGNIEVYSRLNHQNEAHERPEKTGEIPKGDSQIDEHRYYLETNSL